MPLLNFGNRRSAQAGNAGEIGKLDYRIGNPTVGQGVFLTGTTTPIATAPPLMSYQNKETITVSSTALPLTASIAENFNYAFITVETDAVRFWLDGSTPTASAGHKLAAGDTLILNGRDEVDKFRVIRVTTNATLFVSYANGVQ